MAVCRGNWDLYGRGGAGAGAHPQPAPRAAGQRPASSPQPAGASAGSGHGPGPAPAHRPSLQAPCTRGRATGHAHGGTRLWQCHRQCQGHCVATSLWRSPRPPAPAEQCHMQCQPVGQRVPSPCPPVSWQPWLPRRAAWGEDGVRDPGRGRYPAAGGTGAVPRAFIGQNGGAPLGDMLLPTPHHAPLGRGLCPGGCPWRAGSSEGRQPCGDALHPSPLHPQGLAPCLPAAGGDRGTWSGAQAALQAALPGIQEHFLLLRRKVCAGSGNTESFPVRG